MRGTVPSSKVGTGEVDTRVRGGAAGSTVAGGLGLSTGVGPAAWPKAGPASMVATSSVNGASLIACVTGCPPLAASVGLAPAPPTGRRERHNALNFKHVGHSPDSRLWALAGSGRVIVERQIRQQV